MYKTIQSLAPGDILIKKNGEECKLIKENAVQEINGIKVYFNFFGFNVERKLMKDIFESRDGRILVKVI